MTLAEGMRAAGFSGVEDEGRRVFARLAGAGAEFVADAEGGHWHLSISRPVRAGAPQLADWASHHPDTPLDIHLGETRLRLTVPAGDTSALIRWEALAEAMVIACNRWRRAQRDRGEGM